MAFEGGWGVGVSVVELADSIGPLWVAVLLEESVTELGMFIGRYSPILQWELKFAVIVTWSFRCVDSGSTRAFSILRFECGRKVMRLKPGVYIGARRRRCCLFC